MKTFTKILSIAVFSLVAGFAAAQPMPMMGGHDHAQMLKHFGLTDDQAKQVGDLMAKEQTSAVPQFAQLKVLNAQIELGMTASNPDLKAVNALVDKKTQLRGEIEKQFLSTAAQIHQIVGDQIFFELSKAFKAHHRMMGLRGEGAQGMAWKHPEGTPGDKPMMENAPQPENP
jgi:Spy/CpxP family protein refolding chaperone